MEIQKGEQAPFDGIILTETTAQKIVGDLVSKDDFERELKNCKMETAELSEKPSIPQVYWFLAGAVLGGYSVYKIKEASH